MFSMSVLWRRTDPFVPPPIVAEGGLALLRARMLVTFCWLFAATALAALVPSALRPETAPVEITFFGSFALVAAAGPWVLRRTGKTQIIGVAVTMIGVVAAVRGALWMEGIYSASVMWVAALPLLSAFLLGTGTTLAAVAVAALTFAAVGALHAAGVLAPSPLTLIAHRVVNLTSFAVFCAIIARLHEWSASQARASEREAQQLFQVVSRHMNVGTVLIDGATIEFANAAAASLLGRPEGSLQGAAWASARPDGLTLDLADPTGLHEFDLAADAGARRIAAQADAVGGPHGPAVLVTLVDITDRWQMDQRQRASQEALTHSLREKETLLKEIHHRVKNNLQIISSMLALQSDQMPGEAARALLQESVQRVLSMALIHQQLYGMESLSRIEFGAYARSLSDSLCAALAPEMRVRVAATPVALTVDVAVPLALILNELVTNAIKYGRRPADRAEGRIGDDCDVLIEVRRDDGHVVISVADAGPGLPGGVDPATSSTLGLQIVRSLARQLRGALAVDVDRGTRFEVRFLAAA